MATKRQGKGEQGNGDVSIQEMKGAVQSTESKIKQVRQERKLQTISDHKRRTDTIRWITIGIILIIAAVGLYYYIMYYSADVPAPTSTNSKAGRGKTSKTAKPAAKQVKNKQETPPKQKSNGNADTRQEKTTKSSKRTTKPLRLLQRPYSASDPDKPYLVEIINGDNLLEAEEYSMALEAFNGVLKKFPQSPRALYGKAVALSKMSKKKNSNKLMDTAIDFFKKAGLESFIGDKEVRIAALVELSDRAYERGKAGLSLKALEKLVELKEDNTLFSNRLGLGYIADGKSKKAKTHFKSHLEKFPDDHFAQAQFGYVLYSEKRYELALPLLLDGIRNDEGVKVNPKFYLYAGESLVKLNRSDESYILYSEAVSLNLFPSVMQRSLFNEPNLRSMGWWSVEDAGYKHDIRRVEKAIDAITKEAHSVFDEQMNSFSADGITHSSRLILFMNGKKNSKNCNKVPKTCAIIESFPEAAHCRRGNVKFTFVPPKAHIAPFVGTTNTKLQIIVALDTDSESGLRVRVAEDTKIIKAGQIAIVDESFEQEIWNSGPKAAVFLLIDVWHPDLSEKQTRKLGPL